MNFPHWTEITKNEASFYAPLEAPRKSALLETREEARRGARLSCRCRPEEIFLGFPGYGVYAESNIRLSVHPPTTSPASRTSADFRHAAGFLKNMDFTAINCFFGEISGSLGGKDRWEGNAGMPNRAQVLSPPREGGAVLRVGCPWEVFAGRMERAAGGVLRGTAGGIFCFTGSETACQLSLFWPCSVRCDGCPQYSPRRGPWHRACMFHALNYSWPRHPPLGGGSVLAHSIDSPIANG